MSEPAAVPPARLIGSPAIYFSNNSSLFSMTVSHASMSVPPGLFPGTKDNCLLDDNIGGELILNRPNHASANQRRLVDLVDKDNGGNVHFPQGMEQNTGLACTPSLARSPRWPHLKTAKERYTSAKNPCGRAYPQC